jgi:benzylsuccinate CoA-transferase BbsF subunit
MPSPPPARPLEGLRVVELAIAIAGPTCARYLAWFGADVVKIESRNNPDVIRLFASGWLTPDEHGPEVWGETSPYAQDFVGGKRSVGLDLKKPAAMAAARRLLATADVFVTNYSAPALADLGLAFDDVRAVKADIVYVALPGFGADPATPYYPFLAWGPNQAPLVGLDELTGYEDQDPAGVSTISYPDYSSGLHAALGALAALEERDATGEAQEVVLAQFEATVSMLAPYLLDHQLTGTSATRQGNRSGWWAPEGVYACRGEDRWLALSVVDDAAWQALCEVLGRADWAADPRLATAAGRAERADELDAGIAAWSAAHSARECEAWLQARGVAAAELLDAEALAGERHLQDRGMWSWAPSARFGHDLGVSVPVRLADTPGRFDRMAPMLGQDTADVLGDLGYSSDDIEALAAAGDAFLPAKPELRLRRPYWPWAHVVMPDIDWSEVR